MCLPPKLSERYLQRLDELIVRGERIRETIEVKAHYHDPWCRGAEPRVTETQHVDWPAFVKWRVNSASLLAQVVPTTSTHHASAELFRKLRGKRDQVEYGISLLRAIKEDYERGFLGDIRLQVEAELAGDYLGQAEALLSHGQAGPCDHVPAAVLAGAVLERALRILCSRQNPPICTEDARGRPMMLNGLVDLLKKAGVFNEMLAKQLRAWAAIRNHSAHGEFEEFGRADVELMVRGVGNFLATYLV